MLNAGVLFGAMFLALIIGGFIDSRVSVRHPQEKQLLGAPVYLGYRLREAIEHGSRWMAFTLYRHFELQDAVLSGLCVCHSIIMIFVLLMLAGAVSFD